MATDQFELPSGLPEGPWYNCGQNEAYDGDITIASADAFIARVPCEWPGDEEAHAIAAAIASIPAMVEEIERLREETALLKEHIRVLGGQ